NGVMASILVALLLNAPPPEEAPGLCPASEEPVLKLSFVDGQEDSEASLEDKIRELEEIYEKKVVERARQEREEIANEIFFEKSFLDRTMGDLDDLTLHFSIGT